MDQQKLSRLFMLIGCALMAFAVGLGAFGAHGLEGKLSALQMKTYQTGVQYHLVHALAILWGSLALLKIPTLKVPLIFLCLGTLLFSGFCYLYAVTGLRFFAMVVPLGGLSFLFGWVGLFTKILKIKKFSI